MAVEVKIAAEVQKESGRTFFASQQRATEVRMTAPVVQRRSDRATCAPPLLSIILRSIAAVVRAEKRVEERSS